MVRAALGYADCNMAQGTTDLALETAHAGFACIAADDRRQSGIVNFDVGGCKAVGFKLPPHQIAASDLQFFAVGIAGKADDLHAVAQRTGNGLEHIGCGDEDDARQVEGHGEVIVTMRSGDVLTGSYVLDRDQTVYSMDAFLALAIFSKGAVQKAAVNELKSMPAWSPGTGDISSPSGPSAHCLFVNSNITGHGAGTCHFSTGADYKLTY